MVRVEILTDFRCLKAGEVFEFGRGVNLLVGDQGVGKSTLLNLIAMSATSYKEHVKVTVQKHLQFCHFDFEKMNPRMQNHIKSSFEVSSRFLSHGQSNNALLRGLEPSEYELILMDEPESALSIRSVVQLTNTLMSLEDTHCLIVSTHSERLMRAIGKVFDFGVRGWVDAESFIKSQEENLHGDT